MSEVLLYNTTRKGQSRGTPDFVSHDKDRWALDLLPRSRPARRADAAPAARLSLVLADVRAALRPAYRALSPRRAGLPGLRPQRLARPAAVRLHLRAHRCRDGQLHASAGFVALHAVYAGLRWASGLSPGLGPPGAGAGAHHPECGRAQRRPGGDLGHTAGLLGGPAGA